MQPVVITTATDIRGEAVRSPNTINLILPTTTRRINRTNSTETIATTTTTAAAATPREVLKVTTASTHRTAEVGNLNRRATPAIKREEGTEGIRTVEGPRITTGKRTAVAGSIPDISSSIKRNSSSSNRHTRAANRCRVTTRREEASGIIREGIRVMLPTIIITDSTMLVAQTTITATVIVLKGLSLPRDPATPRMNPKSSRDLHQSQRLRHQSRTSPETPDLDSNRRKRFTAIHLSSSNSTAPLPVRPECSHRSSTSSQARVLPVVIATA